MFSDSPCSSAESDTSSGADAEQSRLEIQLRHLVSPVQSQQQDGIATSPLLTLPVLTASAVTQYGLIGAGSDVTEQGYLSKPQLLSARIFQNVAAPSSTFICGSQGSGKSNTLACLLENCLLSSPLGRLPRPLTGVVFHYDSFNSDAGGLPCEAAFLASNPGIKVRILCAPTNTRTIESIYCKIPNVTIEPLQLTDRDLNTKRMLDLMAVGESGMPLYMHVVNRVLRDMRLQQQKAGTPFSYEEFKNHLAQTELASTQASPLKQRLDTLESFMAKKAKTKKKKHPSNSGGNDWVAEPARLTIVDLSCPCVTSEMACSLFNIALHLFLEGDRAIGRIIALDEAHKYMKDTSAESRTLTENLLGVIRLQRHLAARVVISTQEPTVSPKLLDLCSVTIVHRFTSPDWLRTLQGHLAGLSPVAALDGKINIEDKAPQRARPIDLGGKDPVTELFALIVGLKTGQALVFSPSTIVGIKHEGSGRNAKKGDISQKEDHEALDDSRSEANDAGNRRRGVGSIERLAHRALLIDIRSRLTEDGGRSIMAL